jgi:hypothetical protein
MLCITRLQDVDALQQLAIASTSAAAAEAEAVLPTPGRARRVTVTTAVGGAGLALGAGVVKLVHLVSSRLAKQRRKAKRRCAVRVDWARVLGGGFRGEGGSGEVNASGQQLTGRATKQGQAQVCCCARCAVVGSGFRGWGSSSGCGHCAKGC